MLIHKEPIANFVITRNWSPWFFGLIYVIASLVLFGISALVYKMTGGLDISLLGGPDGIAALVAAYVLIGGFVPVFYMYISKKSGRIFYEIAKKNVIDSAAERTVHGASNCAEATNNMVRWPWLALVVTIIISGILFYLSQIHSSRHAADEYSIIWLLLLMPVWFQGIYMIVMIIIRFLVTSWWLYKVFRVPGVSVSPLHPDGCGGLGDLRNYALALSCMIAIFGIGLLLFSYYSVRKPDDCTARLFRDDVNESKPNCHEELMEHGFIVISGDGPPRMTKEGEVKLADTYDSYNVELGRVLYSPYYWVFYLAYFVLSPMAFFGTLATAHGPMLKNKQALLQEISSEFDENYFGDTANISIDEERFERLKRIQSVHEMTQGFHVWPWDPSSIRIFTLVNSPIVVTVIAVLGVWAPLAK